MKKQTFNMSAFSLCFFCISDLYSACTTYIKVVEILRNNFCPTEIKSFLFQFFNDINLVINIIRNSFYCSFYSHDSTAIADIKNFPTNRLVLVIKIILVSKSYISVKSDFNTFFRCFNCFLSFD